MFATLVRDKHRYHARIIKSLPSGFARRCAEKPAFPIRFQKLFLAATPRLTLGNSIRNDGIAAKI